MGFTNTLESSYASLIQRFQTTYTIGSSRECWEYQGDYDRYGYGRAYRFINKKRVRYPAHRLAYCLANNLHIDSLSPDVVIRHTCDNPKCVNPYHLISGTQLDNIQDMIDRGRQKSSLGEQNGQSKLTEQQVIEIRQQHGNKSALELAKEFDCCLSTIKSIINYHTWTHL